MKRFLSSLATGMLLSLLTPHDVRGQGAKESVLAPRDPVRHGAPTRTLGSGQRPITLEGVEVRAARGPVGVMPDRLTLPAGASTVTLAGLPGGRRRAGLSLRGSEATDLTRDTNVLAGVGVEVPFRGSQAVLLEGGRVTLRDPVDVVSSSGASNEYWATWGALQIRF
jgi:hypothetical protein